MSNKNEWKIGSIKEHTAKADYNDRIHDKTSIVY